MLDPERIQELEKLQKTLDYRFGDLNLLNKSLTHKSFVNETASPLKNNERFEFLGDSVLDLIVSDYLIGSFTDFSEGKLSKIRAAVVNETCLAGLARKLNLGRFLLLGKGEEQSGGRDKSSLLANAYEALTGAVYLDGGLGEVKRVFLGGLKQEIRQRVDSRGIQDFKSELQEYTQTHLNCIPAYRVVAEHGPDHEKTFEVELLIQNKAQGRGVGRNKKEAEQAAARQTLETLRPEQGA
ncbi:MAG: ribonuclease III [Nitrospina sp.]|nr:ribonuclease III [Nitrospina sp.]